MAGRIPADRLVATVAGRFYGAAGKGEKEALRLVMEVAERSAPGVVSLERTEGGNGFAVQPLERRFPAESLEALRGAARAALAASWLDPLAPVSSPQSPSRIPQAPGPGWLARVVSAVRRLFSGSA